MDTDLLTQIGKFGLLPALVIYAISLVIKKFTDGRVDGANANGQVDLITGLTNRVASLEAAQKQYQIDLDAERKLRFAAEDDVAALTRRVASLEAQLKAVGLTPA